MNGIFDNKKNEVCWIQEVDEDDHRSAEVQSMETASVAQVIERRRLRFTNQAYPTLNFRNDSHCIIPADDDSNKAEMYDFIDKHAPRTCRMRFVCYFKNAKAR